MVTLQQMQKADKMGRPWYGLVPTLLIGGGLAYLNVSYGGAEVFGWFSNLTSLLTLFGWGMICLSNIRMRHAWKVQGRSVDELPWKSWTWPYGAYWGLSWCIILIIAEFYLPFGRWAKRRRRNTSSRCTARSLRF
jgi:amino acid transporter